jgi:hypothetical protein
MSQEKGGGERKLLEKKTLYKKTHLSLSLSLFFSSFLLLLKKAKENGHCSND